MSAAVKTNEPSALDNYVVTTTQTTSTTTTTNYDGVKTGLDSYPWYIKWSVKIGTVILGCLAILMGFLAAFDVFKFTIRHVFSGVFLIIGGIIVLVFEAPILCSFVRCIESVTIFSNKIPTWVKLIIYLIPAIVALILYIDVVTVFGAIFLIVVAALYLFFTILRARGSY